VVPQISAAEQERLAKETTTAIDGAQKVLDSVDAAKLDAERTRKHVIAKDFLAQANEALTRPRVRARAGPRGQGEAVGGGDCGEVAAWVRSPRRAACPNRLAPVRVNWAARTTDVRERLRDHSRNDMRWGM